MSNQNTEKKEGPTKEALLGKLFATFRNGILNANSEKAKQWLNNKGLEVAQLEVGFISGRFHHKKTEAFKQDYIRIGMLTKSNTFLKSKELTSYSCFGSIGIVFPLKNEKNEISNLCATRITRQYEKPFYLNGEGIYPGYPNQLTQKLYITSDILSAACLIQAKVLKNGQAVMALFSGELKLQHLEVISKLNRLEEIIFIR